MRDRTSKYAVQLFLARGGYITRACWFCNEHGRPTYKNVRKYLEDYNLSLMPGGANAHLGIESSAHKAEVYLNDGTHTIVTVATNAKYNPVQPVVGGWLERANKAENNPRSINPPNVNGSTNV